MAAGLASGCGGGGSLETVKTSAVSSAPVLLQVSLFWGGGGQRSWRGEFGVGEPSSEAAKLRWLYLTDFEEDDHCLRGGMLPNPEMAVPSGWRPAMPADIVAKESPSQLPPRNGGNGATLESSTDGDSDGLCFAIGGPGNTKLVLDFGPGAVLQTSLGELLDGHVIVSVDDSGNKLFAQAIDLQRNAPEFVMHEKRRARRTSLHTHSCFSTNQMQLEPVLSSLRPFVNTVWWTDHSVGDERQIFGGDFEDAEFVDSFWSHFAGKGAVVRAGLNPDAQAGASSFVLEIEANSDEATFGCIYQSGAAGEFNLGLCAKPRLRWSVKSLPQSDSNLSTTYVQVTLHSGKQIRYYMRAPKRPNAATDIVIDAPSEDWQVVERDIAADAASLYGNIGTDGFRRVSFAVECPGGMSAGVMYDEIEIVVPEPHEVVRLQAEKLSEFRDPKCFAALEQSAWAGTHALGKMFPHLTALVPERAPELLTGFDHDPTAAERRAFVETIQAANGAVGTHHMQVDEHYEAFLDGRGMGVDMFEIGGGWWFVPAYSTPVERADRDAHGYPQQDEDEVYPLLVRWDRMTARGLFLTGYGAPDLHMRFEAPSYGWMNRWLTWVFADDDTPEAELRALRSGQACASEWRSDAIMRLNVAGSVTAPESPPTDRDWMGKLVVTDRDQATVIVNLTGAIPGSKVRWIQGSLVRDVADADGFEPARIGAVREELVTSSDFESRLDVDTTRGVFVRAELLNPTGHIVALSNPVTFSPYWPEVWPAGRVAVDWNGMIVERSSGMLLTSARVSENGALELKGDVVSENAVLVLSGGEEIRSLGENNDSGFAVSELADGLVQVSEFGLGEMALEMTPAGEAKHGQTSEMLAIPTRKRLLRSIDVGRVESEGDWNGLGFDEPVIGPLLLQDMGGAYREAIRGRLRFEMDIPKGEPSWIRLRTHGFTPVTGRMELDGVIVGRFERMEALIFELPATESGAAGDRRAMFDLIFDEPEKPLPPDLPALLLKRIELFVGDGVVSY
ncbi:MAG: hypothetical protein ACI87A_001632 [Planctomycetota bacterium]|jgi:hypothetical protein